MPTRIWRVAFLLGAAWPLLITADGLRPSMHEYGDVFVPSGLRQNPADATGGLLQAGRQAIGSGRVLDSLSGLVLVGERRFVTGLSAEPQRQGLEFGLFPPSGFLQTFRPTTPFFGQTGIAGTTIRGVAGERFVARLVNPSPGEGLRRLPPAAEHEQVVKLQRFGTALLVSLLLSENTPIPIEYSHIGVAESKDGSADVLEARGAGGFALRLYLDKSTHRVLMMEPTVRLEVGGPQNAAERWRFSGYVSRSGLSLPKLILIDFNRQVGVEWEFSSVVVNPPKPHDLQTPETR